MKKFIYILAVLLLVFAGCFSSNDTEGNLQMSVNWDSLSEKSSEVRRVDSSIDVIIVRLQKTDSETQIQEKLSRTTYDSTIERIVVDNLATGKYKFEVIARSGIYDQLRKTGEFTIETGDNVYKIVLDKIVYVGDNGYYVNSTDVALNVTSDDIEEVRYGILGQTIGTWSSAFESQDISIGSIQGSKSLIVELKDSNENVLRTKLDFFLDSIPPDGYIVINNDDYTVKYSEIIVFSNITGADFMRFGTSMVDLESSQWMEYRESEVLKLPKEGLNTVYAEFKDVAGNIISYSKTVNYDPSQIATISRVNDVYVVQGGVLPSTVTALMSDGTTRVYEVEWGDMTSNTPGTYNLTITIGGEQKPITLIIS